MPSPTYHIFLSSPGGLDIERETVRDTVSEYNDREPALSGVRFSVRTWEALPVGAGNAQEQINEELRHCDYLLLMLWDRWGTPPGNEPNYTSGAEAEFFEAIKCYNDPASPMRGIAVFFRAVDQRRVTDPGPQLQQVMEFQRRLERSKRVLFGKFDDGAALRRCIENQLARWAREVKDGASKRPDRQLDPDSFMAGSNPANDEQPGPSRSIRERVEELTRAGRLIDAETHLAQAAADERDLDAMVEYGRFLRDRGRLATANGLFARVLELARLRNDERSQAVAHENIGKVHRRRGELPESRLAHLAAQGIFERLGGEQGQRSAAKQNGYLGLIHRLEGNLEQSIAEHLKALATFRELFDLPGQAQQCGSIGRTYQEAGDLPRAEEMLKRALRMQEQLNDKKGCAVVSGHLCRNYLLSRDLSNADEMVALSTKCNSEVGDRWGLATCDLYTGWIALERGDNVKARNFLQKALESFLTMGVPNDVKQVRDLLARLPPG